MDHSLVPMSRKLPSSSDTAGSNLQHACRAVVLLKPSAFDGDCVHAAYVASLDQKSPYPTAVNTGVVRDSSQSLSRGKGQGFAHRGFIRTQAAPRTRLSALFTKRILASRQLAAHRHVTRMPAKFAQFCRGYAHEHAGRRRPLCGAVSRAKRTFKPAALLELVRFRLTCGRRLGLIARLIDQVTERRPIDPRRVYVVGMSAGGAMACVLAVRHSRLFAACASHSGMMYGAASS